MGASITAGLGITTLATVGIASPDRIKQITHAYVGFLRPWVRRALIERVMVALRLVHAVIASSTLLPQAYLSRALPRKNILEEVSSMKKYTKPVATTVKSGTVLANVR